MAKTSYSFSGNFQHLLIIMRTLLTLSIFFLSISSSASDLKQIKIIAYLAPPYITEDNGKINGITIRAIEAAFKEADLSPQFLIYPYSRAMAACATDSHCVLIGSFEGMGKHFRNTFYQVNFINYSTTLFYNETFHPEYKSTKLNQSFSGKKIAVLRSEFDNLKTLQDQGAEIIKLENHGAVMQMLQSGRVDFAHFVNLIGKIEIEKNKANSIHPINESLVVSQGGLIFRDKQLAQKLYQAFVKLHAEGKIIPIMQSEFSDYPKLELNSIVPEKISLIKKDFGE